MAKKTLYELALNITANSAELKKELDATNKKLDKLQDNSSKSIASIQKSALAAVAGIAAAFKTAEKIFKSTQTSGDLLEKKIAGIKEVAATVAQGLANLDFSVSLIAAKRAAEEYAAALDDLGDRKRSVEIISAKNNNEVAKLKGQLRDTTLSEEKRLEVSKRIQEIAQEEFDLRKQIAVQALDAINNKTSTKYKIDLETAKLLQTYVEDYARFNRDQQDALNNAMAAQKKLDFFEKNTLDFKYKEGKKYKKLLEEVNQATAKVPEELQKYIALYRPINDLSDKERDNIGQIIKDWYNANTAIQNYLNTAERVEKKIGDITEKTEQIVRMAPVTPISTSNIVMPRVAPAIDTTTLAEPPVKVLEDWQWFIDELNDIIASGLQNVVSTLSEGLGALVVEGKSSLPKLATSLLGAFTRILDQLSAIAFGVAFGIKAIKKALTSLNPALALAAGIALAALSGLVKAGISALADKSSSGAGSTSNVAFGNFADGGVVYGETIARVAEYSGARTNPEIIAPLDRLKTILGDSGGKVEFEIRDDVLYGILNRRGRRVSSYA